MDITAKIISIRRELDIPEEGFPNEGLALDWYKTHYEKAKGIPLNGGFGYRFARLNSDMIEFDYDYDHTSRRVSINFIPPIDKQVPLDVHASSLVWDSSIDPINASALRLVILVGSPRSYLPLIPSYISADMGAARLLMHSPSVLSEEMRRRILDDSGPFLMGIDQGYRGERRQKNMPLYFDVDRAYSDWIAMKRDKEREGIIVSRKGYLKWIAKRLVKEYGWDDTPESYTVFRYLERAKKIWGHAYMDE